MLFKMHFSFAPTYNFWCVVKLLAHPPHDLQRTVNIAQSSGYTPTGASSKIAPGLAANAVSKPMSGRVYM